MATKAPVTAYKEGQRVSRYLQGTKNLCLQFKACKDFQEVIGFTDANFSAKRSQTGSVVKLGVNVITWRSMKQSEVSLSSAESEVQALASTAVLSEFVRTLRESLCIPTPAIELRCDNTAAIVLATGEGSWRTKSAANKVYMVKEKVDRGLIKVTYVNTLDQCADSLTKFLRGGQDQRKANAHLSLLDLDDWLPRRELKTKASGVQLFSGDRGVFRPRVSRVFSEGPELRSGFTFGPVLLAGEKKVSLVRRKKTSVSH